MSLYINRTYSTYLDRRARANLVDPDENVASVNVDS